MIRDALLSATPGEAWKPERAFLAVVGVLESYRRLVLPLLEASMARCRAAASARELCAVVREHAGHASVAAHRALLVELDVFSRECPSEAVAQCRGAAQLLPYDLVTCPDLELLAAGARDAPEAALALVVARLERAFPVEVLKRHVEWELARAQSRCALELAAPHRHVYG